MNLAVVIVNYNTGQLVADCLKSIAETTDFGQRPRVYVVDNASPDGSGDAIEKTIADSFHSFATLIRAESNGGFAYGNNTGIRAALQDHLKLDAVLLLNPDTIVMPEALFCLERYLDEHPEAGLIGPRLTDPPNENGKAAPQRSAFSFPSISSEFETAAQFRPVSWVLRNRVVAPAPQDYPHECDWLSGAALCIQREVFETVGPMDEGFFLYYEETDYCRRARAMGFSCHHVPESQIVHLEGQSTGVVHRRPARRPQYWFDSRRRYFIRHHGRVYAMAADGAVILGSMLALAKRTVLFRSSTTPPRFSQDLLRQGAISHGIRSRGSLL